MNVFHEEYKRKKTTVDKALAEIKSGDELVVGVAAMEPQLFLSRLHEQRANVEDVQVYTCLNMMEYPFFMQPEMEGHFINNSWFHSVGARKALKAGFQTVTYVPNNLHQAGANLLDLRDPDVYVGVASPMDDHGFFTLSLSIILEKDALEQAKKVVLEVNPKAPRTHGDTQVHISQIDELYEVDYDIPEIPDGAPNEIDSQIATHIANLVQDGSTLQLGIGGLPNAVAKLLVHKKDLGIHTEMFTESMIDLFEAGAITNMKKTLWPGKAICTFALGTRKMYDFVNDNPGVWLLRGRYVNNPYVVAQNDNMISVNTALMIDLTGQVCSESIGTRHYSGTGGQLDTHRGALMSKGGKGIIALTSSTKSRDSKIVPLLPMGSAVTVPRQDLDFVVTEYGAVHMRGLPVNKRAKALISIAHPDHREELRQQAKKLGLF
ncbi:MAG TPA: acetyl-CoA hydrolase/transferase C-terminal domain-containing protein [Thermotogota bacterium]|nr:acetyl-CoA hydrolase/transferase C-terminal domain-containing protein [Thermotogota bacterium]